MVYMFLNLFKTFNHEGASKEFLSCTLIHLSHNGIRKQNFSKRTVTYTRVICSKIRNRRK